MKKLLNILIKSFYLIAGFLILTIIIFFTYATIFDFRPEKEKVEFRNLEINTEVSDTLNIISWNIAFGGLGEQMDFFYDGGKMVISKPEDFLNNQEYIKSFFHKQNQIDFWLIQELDINSKRSYYNDQRSLFNTDHHSYRYFSQNYKVAFVPVPLYQPMGKVNSGLYTLSSYPPYEVISRYFDGNYKWPTKIFMLDRCYTILRLKTQNKGDLILINTHNSAFDDGSLREAQLNELLTLAKKEYQKGNYVVIGGDWNMNPPGYDLNNITGFRGTNYSQQISDSILSTDWQWAYDPNIPTIRDLSMAFKTETTETTIIDFFLLSPNIELIKVKTFNLHFKASDHNPVFVKLKIKD
ncbi:endonuclease/exonuclease/phosphatase family protein [Bacteroidota bacterium]